MASTDTAHPAPPRPARLPARRRFVFGALLAAIACIGLEGASFLLFWLIDGQPFGYARLAAEQAETARAADGSTAAGGGQGNVLNSALHPYLGYVYHEDTNTEAWRRSTGRSVNRWGFNDDREPIQKRSPEKVLVGIFGGSVAAWVGFDGGEALARALTATPRFRGREVVVLTFAVGGYKQPQQLMALGWLLAQGGELDVAVTIDGFNECHLTPMNALAGVYPLYPVLWQQVAGENGDRERLRRLGQVVWQRDQRSEWATAFVGAPLQASVTAQLAWRLRDRILARRVADASRSLDLLAHDRLPFAVRGPGASTTSLEGLAGTIADVWQQCSTQMHRLCAANGIEFHHCLQPNQYVAGSKPMGEAERATALTPGSLQELAVAVGYPALLARVNRLQTDGVRFHDLRDVFAGVTEPVYVDAFCHVNTIGSRLIAERVARAIAGD
jgi:hypothetical protein